MVKYTLEILQKAVSESVSYAQVLSKLGLKIAGGTQAHIKRRIKSYNIDVSHFKGQSWSRDKSLKEPFRMYSREKHINTTLIRDKLIKKLGHRCFKCNLTTWLGSPIPLQIHHKDGDRWNNLIENIELLCGNCHAQTDTFCGKKNNK